MKAKEKLTIDFGLATVSFVHDQMKAEMNSGGNQSVNDVMAKAGREAAKSFISACESKAFVDNRFFLMAFTNALKEKANNT